jgi:hypothetical protein
MENLLLWLRTPPRNPFKRKRPEEEGGESTLTGARTHFEV